MTLEELVSKLNEKAGKTGLSERTLKEYAEGVLKIVGKDGEISDEMLDVHAEILKSISGQISHDVAEAIKAAKKPNNLQSTNQGQQTAPKDGNNQSGNGALEEILKKLSEVQAANAELSKRFEEKEKSVSQDSYKALLSEELKKRGAKNSYILEQSLSGKEFDTKKPVAEIAEECLKSYDSEYTKCFGEGSAPRNGSAGAGDDSKKTLDAFFSRKAEEGQFPKQEGEGK